MRNERKNNNYLKHFLARFMHEFEKNLQKYFSNFYNYFNKSTGDFISNMCVQAPETKMFYSILCSFADNKDVINAFEALKSAVTSEPIYNKGFWHLTDGYLEEQSDGFVKFMLNTDNLSASFALTLIDQENAGKIADLDYFVKYNLCILEEIIETDKQNNDKPISVYQFGEIIMINKLISVMQDLIYNKVELLGIFHQ